MTTLQATAEGRDRPCTRGLPSFEEVYRQHAASVHRFCLSQLADPALAEDVTHDTFVRAFLAYQRAQPHPDEVRTWLLSIARNRTVDEHRRRGRSLRLVARLHRLPEPDGTVEAIAGRRSELARVHDAMGSLGQRERQLIGLRVAAGLSHREIGAVLGISESVAKVATYRALTRLRTRLEVAP